MKGKSKRITKCVMTFVLTAAMLLGAVPVPFAMEHMVVQAEDITLSGSENYTVNDGDVLTGQTWGTVTIADNAEITLSGATIKRGIVCAGTATITLVGTNSVKGGGLKAGIQVGSPGTTLTIKGSGSLTAVGGPHSAGIGLSSASPSYGSASGGDIVIEGGVITATGDSDAAAGIGTGWCDTGYTANLGNISIKGGTVKAIGGKDAAGIGKGDSDGSTTVGSLYVYDTIDLVDISSLDETGVKYMHGNEDVSQSTNLKEYFKPH